MDMPILNFFHSSSSGIYSKSVVSDSELFVVVRQKELNKYKYVSTASNRYLKFEMKIQKSERIIQHVRNMYLSSQAHRSHELSIDGEKSFAADTYVQIIDL